MLSLRRGSVNPRLLELGANVQETLIPPDLHLGLQMRWHRVQLVILVMSDVHEALAQAGYSQPLRLVLRQADSDQTGTRKQQQHNKSSPTEL